MNVEETQITVLNAFFEWPEADIGSLVQTVRTEVAPRMPANAEFSARVQQKESPGVTSEVEVNTLDAWAEAIGKAAGATSIRFSQRDEGFSMDLAADAGNRTLNCWSRAPKPRSAEMGALFRALELGLHLVPQGDRSSPDYFEERQYRAPKPESPHDFFERLLSLVAEATLSGKMTGTLRYALPAGTGQTYQEFQAWKESAIAQWAGISEMQYQSSGRSVSLNLNWNFTSDRLWIRAEGTAPTEVGQALDAAERCLSVAQTSAGATAREHLQGGERSYFTSADVTPDWFQQAISFLSSYLRDDYYSDFKLRIGPPPEQTLTWQTLTQWHANAIDHWEDMVEATAYFSGPGLILSFRYDHLRERIFLSINARTADQSQEIFVKAEQDLGLCPVDKDAYAYHASAYFAVKTFSNSAFAGAVKSAVTQYIGAKFQVTSAVIFEAVDEEREGMTRYTNLSAFLERLESSDAYSAARLELQGLRGAALAVNLLDKRSRLEIRYSGDRKVLSSTAGNKAERQTNGDARKDITNVIAVFKGNLGLTKLGETREATEASRTALKDSAWVLVVLPLVTTLLTNAILTDKVKNAPFAKNTLEIVAPIVDKEKPVRLTAGTVSIRWTLTHEQWLMTHIYSDSVADVQILNASGQVVQEKKTVPSGTSFPLTPGTYRAEVKNDTNGVSAAVTFEISKPDLPGNKKRK